MVITDKIYGTYNIKDPCIEDLINAPSFQRLKGVWQNGLPPRYLGKKIREWTFTRYDHSIGVYLLLRRLGASREEQIAGLLHDVSHMAFSHAYDWIMEDYEKSDKHVNSQDDRHEEYVKSTELFGILEKHKIAADKVVKHTKYELLDVEVPGLCADRIDYFLREVPTDVAKKYLSSLTVHKNLIVIRDEAIAKEFAENFISRNRENWAGYESASRFHLLARTMRYAMEKGFVSPDDFRKTDDFVLEKIEARKDNEFIKRNLEILSMDSLPPEGPFTKARTKFRFVDPMFWRKGRLLRLSENYPSFAKEIEIEKVKYLAPIPVYNGN
jgi:HD superfamily phosphohydrolase